MRLHLLSSVTLSSVISCLFSFEAIGECVEAPSCTDLGYTRTAADCPKGYIKCPWNTGLVYCKCSDDYQYDCTGSNETAGTSKCGDFYTSCGCVSGYKWENGSCVRLCAIADIYYTDNTYLPAEKHDSTKEVLGIVVHVNADGVSGQIMAPWSIDTNGNKTSSNSTAMYWSTENVDISGLPNLSIEAASKDYDSCGNTDAIVKQGSASTYPAAWAARKYAPNEATKGKWCLPAAGIMTNIHNNQNVIQTAIAKVGGVEYPSSYTWSSSEEDYNWVFISNLNTSYGLNGGSKYGYSRYVRPVLEF